MNTVRLGASKAKSVQEVLDWLENNVGEMFNRTLVTSGVEYEGIGWIAKWRQFGGGWFIDVSFTDPKLAFLFSLRWK